MAVDRIVKEADRIWGLWKITEREDSMPGSIETVEPTPDGITNPLKRLEWLTVRLLTARLMGEMGLAYKGIIKDDFGKPFAKGYNLHLSLTHSYPYVAALLDMKTPVGIDLEQPKEKLLRIAPRILQKDELVDCGDNVVKHCVYWCAKEALIKLHGKKDLIFAENLIIDAFTLQNEGQILGRIIVDNVSEAVPLHYSVHPNFVVAFTKRKTP